MVNVLIAEDQAMLLTTLATMLDLDADLSVVCRAENGKQAADYLSANENVDLIITDIEMPKMSGIELAQTARDMGHKSKVIMLTTFARAGYLRRALDAGVSGYLLKDSPLDELKLAIRKVMSGKKMISPELMQEAWIEQDPLTDKERKALKLAQEGHSTETIANKLFLSEGTVRNYLSTASAKLGASNRIEAARIALQKGWL